MASFRNNSEKAKLQRELQFYTNLVSNHEKRLQTGKPLGVKKSVLIKPYENPVQLGNTSRNFNFTTTASVFQKKCVESNENVSKPSVIQNKLKSSMSTPLLFPNRSVIKPSLTKINNLCSATAYRKTYNNPQRTVLYNPKPLVTKPAVSSRLVLLPQNALKNANTAMRKPHITLSNQSNDLQKALFETKKVFMEIRSKKQIDKLNALTKQLEKQNKNIALFNKSKSLSSCSVKSSNILENTKSSDFRSTSNTLDNKKTHCNNMSELDGLKSKMESITKMLSKTPKDLNKKISSKSSSSLLMSSSKKNILDSSSLTTENAKAPIMCSVMKDKNFYSNKLLPRMNHISGIDKGTATTLVKSPKCRQSNYASTPVTRKMNLHKVSDIKKSLSASQATHVKSATIKSIQGNKTFRLSKGSPQLGKLSLANKLLKSPKLLQANSILTPITKRVRLQKLSTIKKQYNMTKLIASKYKIVNKNPSTSLVTSSQSKYFKSKSAASPNSFNKRFQNAYKAPNVIKTLNCNYKVVNLVKTPKRFNSCQLKASTPNNWMKHASKKKKLETCGSTLKYNNAKVRYTNMNYLAKSNSKSLSKSYLNRKSNTHKLNSKYKVVNRPGSSKKLSKSPKLKQDVVRRTKSGVDMDLLLELAAEKELTEEESEIKTLKKRAVLLKRVYKTKNAIVNKNVSSSTGAKVAKMIKAKYSLSKRNAWQKQSFSKRFIGFKNYKDLGSNFQRTSNKKQFYNTRIKRNHFISSVQNRKNITKFSRNHKGSLHYNKTHQKSVIQSDFLKSKAKYTPVSKVLASRVLHQSINRVLTASVKKKKLLKVNTYCMFYNRFGRCNKGLKCTYVHDPSKIAVCTRFLRGTCKIQKCLFSHEISPGKMAICSFFLLGSCTKSNCPYRHETLSADAVLCKAFVQGYCPDGKQCKKAHVLVCPQYIQGFCNKGDACAFPHPPRKEKKVIPKPKEESETPLEVEDFMEQVSRYFQSANEQSVEINETAVVPKRQKLPEQPSFIAL